LKVLHNFGAAGDGTEPNGPLILDGSGNLYGVTFGGPGEYGNGVVFELTPQLNGFWKEAILHNFAAGSDGAFPWGGLLLGGAGNVYGTLQGDFSFAVSGVFELSPGDWSNTLLYNGYAGPGLAFDKLGNLYGEIGTGQNKAGAIGELSPSTGGWTYTQLYSFCSQGNCADGDGEPAPPIWDGKGNLWGTTTEGGIAMRSCSFGCGVIFELTPNGDGTWTYHVQHQFASFTNDGQLPYGSLVMDAAGNFYGSTWLGGAHGHGTVFKFALSGGKWKETILYDFPNCNYGCMVEGTLALDKAGNLYGTAAGGPGSCAGFACGVVFKLAPQTGGAWKYSVVCPFTEATGGVQPFYGVILDAKGNLYGVTSSFGKYGAGTAFEITP